MNQFPLRTDWHDTVYDMRMAGKHVNEIAEATGYTSGGVGKVVANFLRRGVKFPPRVGGSPLAGIPKNEWPNTIHVCCENGVMPNGNRRTCYSQIRADAIRGIECDGGTING